MAIFNFLIELFGQLIINQLINRFLKVYGSWLKPHGSWLLDKGGRLAPGPKGTLGPAPDWGTAVGNEP